MTKEEIKALREAMQMTQAEFAKRLGLKTKGSVSLWETGEREPTGPTLVALQLLAEQNKEKSRKKRKIG